MKLPESVLKEAFVASREKNFALAKMFYPLLFGRRWRYCLLAFSYVKCIDNVVDVDPDRQRALDLLQSQLDVMKRVYAGEKIEEDLPLPTRFGPYLYADDREHGSRLRPILESIIETMAYDVERKGQVLPESTLREHAVKVGATSIRFLALFACPKLELPDAYLRTSSLAYLGADNLIDLEPDLKDEIINVPAEDLAAGAFKLDIDDPGLWTWVARDAARVSELYEEAAAEAARLPSFKMRLLTRVYMNRKRKRLVRVLREHSIEI